MLVGIVALIFLGPRKLPEMARKMGKIMSEFRSTTNEFKETWQREVNFEEEAKALNLDELEAETIAHDTPKPLIEGARPPTAPEIKEADPSKFDHLLAEGTETKVTEPTETPADVNDKGNWL